MEQNQYYKPRAIAGLYTLAAAAVILGTTLAATKIQDRIHSRSEKTNEPAQSPIEIVVSKNPAQESSERISAEELEIMLMIEDMKYKESKSSNYSISDNSLIPRSIPANGRVDYIVSNEFFEDTNYLTKEDIRNILTRRKSCLRDTGIETTIVESAKKRGVNPLLLLTRLQAEQSLVTKKKASARTLAYATGYGAFDNGRRLKSQGLNYQVQQTARNLRKHYDNYRGQTVVIDNGARRVIPKNAATYAFLKYTPWSDGAELNSKVISGLIAQVN